jgi:pilus assembly protein CpaC
MKSRSGSIGVPACKDSPVKLHRGGSGAFVAQTFVAQACRLLLIFTVLIPLLAGAIHVCVAQVSPAQSGTYQINVGEAINVPADNVAKLAVADPAVADVVLLSDREISIIGKKPGVTTLSVVRTEGRPTQIYRIEVGNDLVAATIRQMVGTNIIVRAIGDTLVLDGYVTDELEAQRAVQVATAYRPQVVNLIEVRQPRQIKVRTRIVEVNSDAIKNIGFQWFGPQGQVQYAMQYIGGGSIISGFLPTRSEFGGAGGTIDPTTVTLTVLLDALLQKNYARLLSEPTLVTFSGKEASFLVGQEVPIVQQLPQSFTVEFKQVGVRMKVKPVADSQNHINTSIHAEVSQIGGSSVNGIPIINTKMADTTLQVNDGQTVVIGGLLENNISRDILRKLPWLAEIPVIGALFRDKQFEQVQREVLFFMTPEIVKDVDAYAANAAETPYMQKWNNKQASKRVLPVPRESDNWGLHRPDAMGFTGAGLRDYEQPIFGTGEKHHPREKAEHHKKSRPAKATAAPAEMAPATEPAPPAETQPPPPAPSPEEPPPAKEPTTNFTPARPAGE